MLKDLTLAFFLQSDYEKSIAKSKSTFPTECPEGEHALETPWTFWFDKKLAHNVTDPNDYVVNLQYHGTVHSVEQFWRSIHNC